MVSNADKRVLLKILVLVQLGLLLGLPNHADFCADRIFCTVDC